MTKFQGTPLEGFSIEEIKKILGASEHPLEITEEAINTLGSDPTLPIIFQFQWDKIGVSNEDGVRKID